MIPETISMAVTIDASFLAGTNLIGAAYVPGGIQSEPPWGDATAAASDSHEIGGCQTAGCGAAACH
jgi:hypothetical protein